MRVNDGATEGRLGRTVTSRTKWGFEHRTKTFNKGALLAAVAFAATPALAANPETFTAKAVIQKPIDITKTSDLDFGTITMGSTLSSEVVTVAATSGATASCGSSQLVCTGTSQPAAFDVTGVGTQTVTLSYGTTPVTSLTNAANDTVSFSLDAPGSVDLTDGAGTFYVGGEITVADTTKPGSYSADIDVTASYQ